MFVLRRIASLVIGITLNGVILYLIAEYIPELGFDVILSPSASVVGAYFITWVIFRFFNTIVRFIVSLISWIINILTLWIFSALIQIGVNLGIFYTFREIINTNSELFGFSVVLGTVFQIIILWVVIWLMNFIIKKI
jgi:uncharacterized membrane protein YvlD (DUF360 family)